LARAPVGVERAVERGALHPGEAAFAAHGFHLAHHLFRAAALHHFHHFGRHFSGYLKDGFEPSHNVSSEEKAWFCVAERLMIFVDEAVEWYNGWYKGKSTGIREEW
jgi:hypothetical protein